MSKTWFNFHWEKEIKMTCLQHNESVFHFQKRWLQVVGFPSDRQQRVDAAGHSGGAEVGSLQAGATRTRRRAIRHCVPYALFSTHLFHDSTLRTAGTGAIRTHQRAPPSGRRNQQIGTVRERPRAGCLRKHALPRSQTGENEARLSVSPPGTQARSVLIGREGNIQRFVENMWTLQALHISRFLLFLHPCPETETHVHTATLGCGFQ